MNYPTNKSMIMEVLCQVSR